MAQRLILFDFDGTLTTKDTMIEFIKFVKGSGKLYLGYLLLSPTLFGLKAGLVRNDLAKMRLLKHHFGGMEKASLEAHAQAFAEKVVPGLLRSKGMETLENYRQAGDRVIMVSASLDLWLTPWTESIGLELLSTKAEWRDGRFTGKLATPNCHGPEKVRRIKDHLASEQRSLKDYAEVIAYGDSSGDKEMLELATQAHFKPFRD